MYLALPTFRLADHQIATCLAMTATLDLAPGPGGSHITDDVCAIYGSTFDHWFPTLSRCVVVVLYPSSQIVAHADAPIPGTRYHIPLQTNPSCYSFHDGVWMPLLLGQVYSMDPTKLHGAVNWGETMRLHLILDVDKE